MANNFDDLDFGDTDFGNDSFNNNGFDNNGFDDGFGSDSFGDDSFDSNDNQNSSFGDSLDNMQENSSVGQNSTLKKYSWVMVIIGIVIVMIVIIISSNISKKKRNQTANNSNATTQIEQTTTQANDMNANNILETNSTPDVQSNNMEQQIVINSTTDDNFEWYTIDDKADIDFSQNVDLTFTITSITHRARKIDTNNNLVVETVLLGSLSGMSGTYEIHVPYNKGVKLNVGMNFTVHVQLGSYNDKTVVGNISY